MAIKQAIRSAVLDGLQTIKHTTSQKYWYYLSNNQLLAYNVSIKAKNLNYILLYKTSSKLYRVNCDISFIDWKPYINSFVQLYVTDTFLFALNQNIMILANSQNFLDLTDLLIKKEGGSGGGIVVVPGNASGKS